MKYNRVLIIDDSITSRMIIKKCLNMAGINNADFIEADNGIKALDVLAEQNIDLIITDIIMPKLNGTNLIKRIQIKDKMKNIPVIIISSIGHDEMEWEINHEKIIGIIKKPLTVVKLVQVLGEMNEI